jgi:hypothetical protein
MSAGRQDDLIILLGRVGEQYADPDDWRALIRAGRLRRMDSIAARRPTGTTYQRADAVPELAALFEEEEATPRAAASPAPPTAPPVITPLPRSTAVPSVGAEPAGRSAEPSRRPAEPSPVEPVRPPRLEPTRAPPRPADVRRPEPAASMDRPRGRRRNGCGLGGLVLMGVLGLAAFQLTRCVLARVRQPLRMKLLRYTQHGRRASGPSR